MAKQRIQNYIFLPGVSKSSNIYPNAYTLLNANKEFIKAETIAYINAQITSDNATNLYPNAVTLLTNNKQFIIDEIIAWIAARVTANTSPFSGYTYNSTSCRRDTGYLIDAYIYDIRYGGNEKTIDIAKSFWLGGVAQLISPTQEVAGFTQVTNIINNYILTRATYTSEQSPVTSTQNKTAPSAEAGVTTIVSGLSAIINNVIPNGLSVLPTTTYSTRNYAGYGYDPTKCNRDVGLVIDAYLNDLRYGGNSKTRTIATRFWNGTTPQLGGDRKAETTAQTFIRNLVATTILPQSAYTVLQSSVARYTNPGITFESNSDTKIISLADTLIAVITNGLTSLPTFVNGVSSIRFQGKYDLDTLLLITNTTQNDILYNFSDPALSATITTDTGYVTNDYWQDDDFQSYRNAADYVTTVTLNADTSSYSLTDDIQIFVEAKELKVRPYDFGTDAIERHRVAQAQSMLDADFEYGLQPTKWQAIGISRGYPSVYEVPGTDTAVTNVTTDASTGTAGTGESLITVTTSGPHGFTVGIPFTIKSLANSISGFSRAEGTFIINTVPTTTTFTYYAQSKVGTSNGQVLATNYTQLRKAAFYTGASIGQPTFGVYSNGSLTTFASKFITAISSDQIAFTGTIPAIGSPLSGANMSAGAQVTGVVGPGGLAVTATIQTNVAINDTQVIVSSATGILEGMAIDNGSGTSLFVTGIVGTTVGLTGPVTTDIITGSLLAFYSAVTFSEATTASIADSTPITAAAIASILITFASPHGLVPGASILVDISSAGSNHTLAKGPAYVEIVPSSTTLRYTARAAGTIDTNTLLAGIVYSRPDSYFIHRPYDGGVMLGTGGPQHGAQAIRMSKKYIRYQSGKGVNYCTGALFAPSFSLQNIIANATAIGSYITLTLDDVDHGCQVGGTIKISGVDTRGYNGTYIVTDVISERVLRVQAKTVLASVSATLTTNAQIAVVKWHGSTVRAGTFDDQNGIFFQYDGQNFGVGRRSSTFQIAGVSDITKDANLMTGTNTRFRDQVKAGDRIVIKGMTHVVTKVISQTQMTVNPDYRGASNAVQAKICLIQDFVIPQSQFNLDKLDGTGPSGYNIDVTKMQMIGMQWSWYAVGFIDFMLRGSDGNFIFFHRIRNSNVNTEAYMRTGNQPVRYEVINESAKDKLLTSITATQTTIPLVDSSNFPNESGVVMIDEELISYSGKSSNSLIGCTRSSPMTNFLGGSQRTFNGGTASTHEYNTGVILVSNTISPIISHWGSAMLADGNFDTDRGYIFNYAATNISVSTTKQTAFLLRLAPSVSNASIGDLGDRELLNRAQLLLKAVEITADAGTGGIVVEGVLNPQNYPINPGDIQWSGLQGSAQGGQPSFAQIAPGGSVSWAGGVIQTTNPSTTLAFPTGTVTARYVFSPGSIRNGTNWFYITQADYNTYTSLGFTTGLTISGTGIPANTTITGISSYGVVTPVGGSGGTTTYYRIGMSNSATVDTAADLNLTVSNSYLVSNTSTIFFQKTSWESTGAVAGTEVSDTLFPAGTKITTATLLTYFSTQYYRVTMSQTSTSTAITPGTTTITFKFGQPPYALPGETVFSFIAAPGTNSALDLTELKELTNTTLGGRGCYPNGPDVLAINVYKAAGTAISTNIVIRWGEAQA